MAPNRFQIFGKKNNRCHQLRFARTSAILILICLVKNILLPPFDQAASALVEDLKERGKLDETLVVMLTDFGRTPKINGNAGRDHFPGVYSAVFAGGGIQGGQVYGKSNPTGFEPAEKACGPPDLHATIFHALGINPEHMIYDTDDRPLPICDGKPLPLF